MSDGTVVTRGNETIVTGGEGHRGGSLDGLILQTAGDNAARIKEVESGIQDSLRGVDQTRALSSQLSQKDMSDLRAETLREISASERRTVDRIDSLEKGLLSRELDEQNRRLSVFEIAKEVKAQMKA
jgi:hypothetical protein